MRGRKSITDLSVFKEINIIMNVNVLRPMLDFRKNIIYEISQKYQIPYFLDTTPDWSCRGKMRRQIFPKCEDCYSDSFMNSLVKLGKESDELGDITQKYIITPITNAIQFGNFGFYIPKSDVLKEQLIFNNIIRSVLLAQGVKNIKQRSLNNLLENYDNTSILLNVVNEYFTLIDTNNIIFVSKSITNLTKITITNAKISNDKVLENLIHGNLIFRCKKKKITPNYSYNSFNKYFKNFIEDNYEYLITNTNSNNLIALKNLT